MASIGERIAKRRKERGLTQGGLAKIVKVSRAAVSQWENGNTKGLKPENLVACADALLMSIRELATGRTQAGDDSQRYDVSQARGLRRDRAVQPVGQTEDSEVAALLNSLVAMGTSLINEHGYKEAARVVARLVSDLRRDSQQPKNAKRGRRKTAKPAAQRHVTGRTTRA